MCVACIRSSCLLRSAAYGEDYPIWDQVDTHITDLRIVGVMPQSHLDFSDVSRSQQQHKEAGDTQSSAVRVRDLFVDHGLEEAELGIALHSSVLQLLEQSVLVDADPHGADLMSVLGEKVLGKDVAIQVPVVVSWAADLLSRRPVLHGPSHADNEDGSPLPDGGRFSLVHRHAGVQGVQLLGSDEMNIFGQALRCRGMSLEKNVGIALEDVVLGVRDDLPQRSNVDLEMVDSPLLFRNSNFKV